jgi:hypothetical protein
MNGLLYLPGQVVHANLRGAAATGFPMGIERCGRPYQICVNLFLCLLCSVCFTPCFRVSVVSLSPLDEVRHMQQVMKKDVTPCWHVLVARRFC